MESFLKDAFESDDKVIGYVYVQGSLIPWGYIVHISLLEDF